MNLNPNPSHCLVPEGYAEAALVGRSAVISFLSMSPLLHIMTRILLVRRHGNPCVVARVCNPSV